jgi:hypothetical protein
VAWELVLLSEHDSFVQERRLKDLSQSAAAWYSSAEAATVRRDGCTPNTRVAVLGKLRSWAYHDQSEKIYWLNGMAGTGKTTIAYSLCGQLDDTRTLAASFFCSRQLPSCRDVNLILPTISYQLARFSRPFRFALSSSLEEDPGVHTRKLSDQFEKLIVRPLRAVKDTIPADLVVVIDALDECQNDDGVGQILDTLLSRISDLPIKFFVTSRPEAKILDQMRSGQNKRIPVELRLHELEHSIVREDIETYLKIKLAPIQLSDAQFKSLVQQAGVLFIYAATVVRYVGADNFSRSPQKRLAVMLAMSNSPSSKSHKDIDFLYATILAAAFDNDDLEDFDREEMELVLRTVLCAQEPLAAPVIAGLLKLDSEDSVHAALRSLLSVLNFSETTGIVTTLHASFPDYMFDRRRSERFHCDAQSHNGILAQLCFDMMKTPNPPFNICGLESSYLFDKDVPNLDEKVDNNISKELYYACRYWGTHFELSKTSEDLVCALYDFLSVRLLLWMEVLNLKQSIHAGAGILYRIQTWSQVCIWYRI